MYDNHFGLKETPFTIAPDPRFLYMSERHREALAHLVYGFETDGGFVMLTGEVGTGKTTISRCLLEQLPDNSNVAVVLNPKLSAKELLETICDELHIEYPEGNTSLKTFIDRINAYLLETNAQGRKTVVIIEEAQNLEMDVLEQLRLLTNLETNQRKLLQIIMIGQPELLQLLARPELRQLEQRITARYHLLPLSRKDTIDYIKHRLEVAGLKEPVFSFPLLKKVYKYTGGIPRKINLLCDRAMLGAYVQNQKTINKKILDRAAREVFGESVQVGKSEKFWSTKTAVALATVVMVIVGGFVVYSHKERFAQVVARLKNSFQTQPVLEKPDSTATMQPGSFLKLLDMQNTDTSKQLAFKSLFELWGKNLPLNTANDPCDAAVVKGLGCMTTKGDLHSLRQIDRPAVLRFMSKKGDSVFATVAFLDNEKAALMIDNQQVLVSNVDLQSRWFGDFTVLWRLPPSYSGAIKLGTSGPDVQWLASQLASISGQQLASNAMISYDAILIRQVKDFQTQQGLQPDGIAGAQTLIRINSVAGNDVPRLTGDNINSILPDKQSASAFDVNERRLVAQADLPGE